MRGEIVVAPVAQTLEGLGEPNARKRRSAGSRRSQPELRRCSTATLSSSRSGKSLVPTIVSLRRATLASRSARTLGHDTLDQSGFRAHRRRRQPCSMSLEERTRPSWQSASVSASMAPEPAAGSATRWRFDSSIRMVCVLRAMRRAKASGSAERRAEGQHRHRVGAADSSGERRDGAAHDVPVRIALGHHAPGGLGADEGGRGVSPQASSMRAHNFRKPRNLAMVRN